MPEIQTALTTNLHNIDCAKEDCCLSLWLCYKSIALSIISYKSIALSNSKACTVMQLLSK